MGKKMLSAFGVVLAIAAFAGAAGAQDQPAGEETLGSTAVVAATTTTTTTTATTTTAAETGLTTPEAAPAVPAQVAEAPASAEPPAVAPSAAESVDSAVGVIAQQSCDPNYQGACVPTNIGEVNCADVPGTNFQVVGQDIYNLDQGGIAGIACESDDAAVAATGQPAAPSTVSGPAASTSTADTLPETGTATTLLAVLGLVVLALGAALISFGGWVANPLTGRLRGGFTVTRTDRSGNVVRYRVTSRR